MGLIDLGIIGILYWASSRGIDLSDEACGLMRYTNPEQIDVTFRWTYLIVNKLLLWAVPDPFNVRILRLVLTLLSSIFLSYSAFHWIKSNLHEVKESFLLLVPVIVVLGSFLSYNHGTQALSYNSMSTILLNVFVGVLIIPQTKRLWIIPIGLSILNILLLLNKFQNGILAFIIVIIWIIAKMKWKEILINGSLFLLSFGSMLFLSGFTSSVTHQVIEALNVNVGHEPLTLIIQYKDNLIDSLKLLYEWYPWSVTIWASLVLIQFLSRFFRTLTGFMRTILPIIIIGDLYFYRTLGGDFIHNKLLILPFLVYLIHYLFEYIFVLISHGSYRSRKLWGVLLLLILLPGIGSAGTNNNILLQSTLYLSGWLLFGLIIEFIKWRSLSLGGSLIMILIGLISITQIINRQLDNPYRQDLPLIQQKTVLKNTAIGEGLLTSNDIAESIDRANTLLKEEGYQVGSPIFAYSMETGFVYLAGGWVPGMAWYKPFWPEKTCFYLKHIDPGELRSMFLMLPMEEDNASLYSCLMDIGINFETDYKMVGSFSYPRKDKLIGINVYAPLN